MNRTDIWESQSDPGVGEHVAKGRLCEVSRDGLEKLKTEGLSAAATSADGDTPAPSSRSDQQNGECFGAALQIKAWSEAAASVTLATYKTSSCPYPDDHEQRACPFHHGDHDRRRLNTYSYQSEPCDFSFDNSMMCCPKGDSCSYAHNRVEVFYHPDVVRQRLCATYPHVEGCRRGRLCSFAHSREELVKEYNEEEVNSQSVDFFMYRFKTLWCPVGGHHDWHQCNYAHTYQDVRRVPDIGYSSKPCVAWSKRDTRLPYKDRCELGVKCPYSHGAKEQLYHPTYYKTMPCMDAYKSAKRCPRGALCAFYHSDEEQRHLDGPRHPTHAQLKDLSAMLEFQPAFERAPVFTLTDDDDGSGSRFNNRQQVASRWTRVADSSTSSNDVLATRVAEISAANQYRAQAQAQVLEMLMSQQAFGTNHTDGFRPAAMQWPCGQFVPPGPHGMGYVMEPSVSFAPLPAPQCCEFQGSHGRERCGDDQEPGSPAAHLAQLDMPRVGSSSPSMGAPRSPQQLGPPSLQHMTPPSLQYSESPSPQNMAPPSPQHIGPRSPQNMVPNSPQIMGPRSPQNMGMPSSLLQMGPQSPQHLESRSLQYIGQPSPHRAAAPCSLQQMAPPSPHMGEMGSGPSLCMPPLPPGGFEHLYFDTPQFNPGCMNPHMIFSEGQAMPPYMGVPMMGMLPMGAGFAGAGWPEGFPLPMMMGGMPGVLPVPFEGGHFMGTDAGVVLPEQGAEMPANAWGSSMQPPAVGAGLMGDAPCPVAQLSPPLEEMPVPIFT